MPSGGLREIRAAAADNGLRNHTPFSRRVTDQFRNRKPIQMLNEWILATGERSHDRGSIATNVTMPFFDVTFTLGLRSARSGFLSK